MRVRARIRVRVRVWIRVRVRVRVSRLYRHRSPERERAEEVGTIGIEPVTLLGLGFGLREYRQSRLRCVGHHGYPEHMG